MYSIFTSCSRSASLFFLLLSLGLGTVGCQGRIRAPQNDVAPDPTSTASPTPSSSTASTPVLSNDAKLLSLTLSSGSLSPSFASSTLTYTASISNGTTNITLVPTVNHTGSTLTVNGTALNSGATSAAISMSVGFNTVHVIVTAQDGTSTQTYTITVTRAAALTNDATLSALSLSTGTLSPSFVSGTIAYTASIPYGATSITTTPTTNQAGASVTVNGNATTSGSASSSLNMNIGSNTITVIVTAQDTTTTNTYTITVTRAALSTTDAALSALSLSTGTLSPVFASGTIAYTASIPYGTTSITTTPTVHQAGATVTVNGNATTSGLASASLNMNVGANTITVIITAQDTTTTKTYTITVTRANATTIDATLSALTLSTGTLSPVFASGTIAYTASIPHGTTSITTTPTVNQAGASVTVNGNATTSGSASASLNMSVGDNTVTAIVTAPDGTTHKTYTITVTRAAASDNAWLSGIELSAGTLVPSFNWGVMNYTVTLLNSQSSLTFTPTSADSSNPDININNGTIVSSGTASSSFNPTEGTNTYSLVVTAEDGSTHNTYTITVNRYPAASVKNYGGSPFSSSMCSIRPEDSSLWCASGSYAEGNVSDWGGVAQPQAPFSLNTSGFSFPVGVTTDFSVGPNHVCVINGGSLNCSGGNSWGQLGDGSTTSNYTGFNAGIVGLIGTPTSVALGYDATYALTSLGNVYGFGKNSSGQIGQDPLSVIHITTPYAIDNSGNATAIAAGDGFACEIRNNSVYCWGIMGSIDWGYTPAFINMASTPTRIVAGKSFACAVLSDQSLTCWGGNSEGELGIGNTTDTSAATLLTLNNTVSRVAAGNQHACALLTDSTVQCWGNNDHGQLGSGDYQSSTAPFVLPVYLNGTTTPLTASDLWIAGSKTCVTLTDNYTIQCWGQYANMDGTDSTQPITQYGFGASGGAVTAPASLALSPIFAAMPNVCIPMNLYTVSATGTLSAATSSTINIDLHSNPNIYSDSGCGNSISTTSISAGTNSTLIYYQTTTSQGSDNIYFDDVNSQFPSGALQLNIGVQQ